MTIPAAGVWGDCRLSGDGLVVCGAGAVLKVGLKDLGPRAEPSWACDARVACPAGEALAAPRRESAVTALHFEDRVRYAFSAAAAVPGLRGGERAKNANLFLMAPDLCVEDYPVAYRKVPRSVYGSRNA